MLAVGDGANDLDMISRAGLGVAYHAKPIVAAAAACSISHGDLTGLLYLQGYRNQGVFYEAIVNRLLDDFVAACRPVRCRVVGAFTPRGGITTTVTCVYEAGR